MDYYEKRARAVQHIAEMVDKDTPVKKMEYAVAVTYGFSSKFLNETIELIRSQNG